MQKKSYRPSNWRDYNKSLVKRGSLTVWFDKNSIDSWYSQEQSGERGRPEVYSGLAIECCLTLKMVFQKQLMKLGVYEIMRYLKCDIMI